MQIEIILSSKSLYNKLRSIVGVISTKSTIPTHSYFLFKIENKELKITATDLQTTITTVVDTNKIIGEGIFLIEHSVLLNGIKELSDQPIKITVNTETLYIEISYDKGIFSMMGIVPDDFITIKNNDTTSPVNLIIQGDLLISGIKTVLPYATNDELRPVMCSVFIECVNHQLNFTATNGYYMAVQEINNINFDDFSVILSTKASKIFADLIKDNDIVNIYLGSKTFAARFGEYEVITRVMDGRYPNYQAVIPKDNNLLLQIEKKAFFSSLKRVSVFSNKESFITMEASKNKLILNGIDSDFGNSAKECIPCEYNNQNVKIGFKSKYLQQCLKSIYTEEVLVSLKDSAHVALLNPVSDKSDMKLSILLMPMSISEL